MKAEFSMRSGAEYASVVKFRANGRTIVKSQKALRTEAGRTGPFEITTPSALGETPDAVKRYEDVGVTRLSLGPAFRKGMTAQDVIDFVNRVGDEVIAKT